MTKESFLFYFTMPVYISAILVEIGLGVRKRKELYETKDTALSIWYGLAGAGTDLLFKGICFLVLNWCNAHALYKPDLLQHYPVAAWIVVFLGQDFCFYWLHRVEHNSRLFWAVHSNHHSSPKYNFAVALRSSVLQPAYRYLFYIPVAFLGFDGLTIMFMYALNQFYQFWLHTETIGKLPRWYESIFVTPSHHRVHHASNVAYLDRNMGQVLIIWDKLFGTFQEEHETPVYGLTKPLENYHPVTSIFQEFAKIGKDLRKPVSFSDKIRYIFAPPGWSHDGSTKTADQLRKEALLPETESKKAEVQ